MGSKWEDCHVSEDDVSGHVLSAMNPYPLLYFSSNHREIFDLSCGRPSVNTKGAMVVCLMLCFSLGGTM